MVYVNKCVVTVNCHQPQSATAHTSSVQGVGGGRPRVGVWWKGSKKVGGVVWWVGQEPGVG